MSRERAVIGKPALSPAVARRADDSADSPRYRRPMWRTAATLLTGIPSAEAAKCENV